MLCPVYKIMLFINSQIPALRSSKSPVEVGTSTTAPLTDKAGRDAPLEAWIIHSIFLGNILKDLPATVPFSS